MSVVEKSSEIPLDPETFAFWFAPQGMTLSTGDGEELALPEIPLPLFSSDVPEGSNTPSERLLGDALYEYLCRFPDCDYAADYVEILRQAYPFLISDLGSQLLVLDVKNTEVSAIKRKIALLKIMLHLEADNFGLLHKLGSAYYHLGLHPDALAYVDNSLTLSRRWLEMARRQRPDNVANLNLVGQVCFLCGNYHQAKLYWQSAVSLARPQDQITPLQDQLDRLEQGRLPIQPLKLVLEKTGQAKKYFDEGEFVQAYELMDDLVRNADLVNELPRIDVYYFLGLTREQVEDYAGAYEAFMMVTQLDADHEGARRALARIAPGEG